MFPNFYSEDTAECIIAKDWILYVGLRMIHLMRLTNSQKKTDFNGRLRFSAKDQLCFRQRMDQIYGADCYIDEESRIYYKAESHNQR
jgi:hypothetical protein